MLTGVYETLRSAGRELVLELGGRPSLAARVDELREAARCLAEDQGSGDAQRETARRGLVYLEQDTAADRLFDLGDLRLRGERAASYEEARRRVEQAALDELAAADRDLLQELLAGFAAAQQGGQDGRRSTSPPPKTAICSRSPSPDSLPPTRGGRIANQRSTSKISSCGPATFPATTTRSASGSSCVSARSWSTIFRTRTACSAS